MITREQIIEIIKNNAEDSELLLNPRWVRMVADEILKLFEYKDNTDWAGLDPVKWDKGDLNEREDN